MGFEQPKFNNEPTGPKEKKAEENGWIVENGIWKKRTKEELIESMDQSTEKNEEEIEKEGDKRQTEIDQEYEKIENKEYKTPGDIEKMKKLEREHQELSNQIKKGEEESIKENEEIKTEKPKGEKKEEKEKPEPKAENKESKLEKEIIADYYEEIEKIKNIPENTNGQKKQKAEKYFELIDSWKDFGHKDNYKGIQKIILELDKLEPGAWFYNLAKTQKINELAITMASKYKEWGLENKEKIKLIKKIINKQEKGIWENKDKTLKQVAKILASQEIPYKDNIDFIIKDIKNPEIKTEAITEISDIEKKSIEQKKQLLKKIKEEAKEEKIDPENLEKTFSSLGLDKLLQDPEAISKMFAESSELMKNPEIQKKWQELNKTIEQITKEKKGTSPIPDSIKKAKESIKKPGSGLETIFGAAGWIILLFLTLFMLVELKGVDYLVQQSSGGKKK